MEDATPDWLIQHSRLRGEARAVAITGSRLQVASQSLFGRRRYTVHLAVLAAEPRRRRHLAWRWLLAAVAAFGLAALLWPRSLSGSSEDLAALFALLTMLGGLAALGGFVYRSYSMDEYRTRFADCTVCALHRRRPSAEAYLRFVSELRGRIEAEQESLGAKPQRLLAAELSELRRLAQEGALPEAAYERAKQTILAQHGQAEGQPMPSRA